jgi:hypothetical protein
MREKRVSISLASAPALATVRSMQSGDTITLHRDATQRADWPRYAAALVAALSKGADIRRMPT